MAEINLEKKRLSFLKSKKFLVLTFFLMVILLSLCNRSNFGGEKVSQKVVFEPKTLATINLFEIGKEPLDVALSEDSNSAYVLSEYGSVIEVSLSDFKVRGSFKTGATVSKKIIINGKFAYISNCADDSVLVIDLAKGEVVKTFSLKGEPAGMVFSPDNRYLYVTTQNYSDCLSVIDTNSGTIVATIDFPEDSGPEAVAVLPNKNKVYVALYNRGTVAVISTGSYSITKEIWVNTRPKNIIFNPFDQKLYVSGQIDGKILVIDPQTDEITEEISLGKEAYPGYLALDPKGQYLFATNCFSGEKIFVVDVERGTFLQTVGMPSQSQLGGIVVTPDGKHLLVPNWRNHNLTVIQLR